MSIPSPKLRIDVGLGKSLTLQNPGPKIVGFWVSDSSSNETSQGQNKEMSIPQAHPDPEESQSQSEKR